MALAVGMTATMFAVSDPFLLRPLPYQDHSRLVLIRTSIAVGNSQPLTQVPTVERLSNRTDLFAGVAGYGESREFRAAGPLGMTLMRVIPVTPNLFDVLGVSLPLTARELEMTDAGRTPIVLTTGPLVTSLGGRAAAVGREFQSADGRRLDVVAVTGDEFVFPSPRALRRPDGFVREALGELITVSAGRISYVTVIARLTLGISVDQASAAMATEARDELTFEVTPLFAAMTQSSRSLAIGALLAGLLVTAACIANVVNLMVARTIHRTREFTTRRALGAQPRDLLRLVAVEVAALSVLAVLAGLALSAVSLQLIALVIPAEYAFLGTARLTLRVVTVAASVGLATMVFTLLGTNLARRNARSSSINQAVAGEARRLRIVRFVMVVGQTATAVLLLVGATFLGRSYLKLWSQDTGYSPNAVVVSVLYPASVSGPILGRDILNAVEGLSRIPGVTATGATTGPLLDDAMTAGGSLIQIGNRRMLFEPKQITAGYFDAAGATPIAGRSLVAGDEGWRGLVVNLAFVAKFWPGDSADSVIGRIVSTNNGQTQGSIVGVVPDLHDRALDRPASPAMYRILDSPRAVLPIHFLLAITRDDGLPHRAVRQIIGTTRHDAVVVDVSRLEDRLATTVRDRTFATVILCLFGIAALGVTATGLAGVIGFFVARRTREIAIRRALGAQDAHVTRMVVHDAASAAGLGALVGLAVGGWTTGLLKNYLFGLEPVDPVTMASVAGVTALVAVLAAWMPVRRALALSPTEGLRVD